MSRAEPTIEQMKALQRELEATDEHVVCIEPHHFTIAHTDDERANVARVALHDCELHRWLANGDDLIQDFPSPGYYLVVPYQPDQYSESYPVPRWEFVRCDNDLLRIAETRGIFDD